MGGNRESQTSRRACCNADQARALVHACGSGPDAEPIRHVVLKGVVFWATCPAVRAARGCRIMRWLKRTTYLSRASAITPKALSSSTLARRGGFDVRSYAAAQFSVFGHQRPQEKAERQSKKTKLGCWCRSRLPFPDERNLACHWSWRRQTASCMTSNLTIEACLLSNVMRSLLPRTAPASSSVMLHRALLLGTIPYEI